METPSLKEFIESFFSYHNASISAAEAGLEIALPGDDAAATEVAEFLGKDRFRLVFDLKELSDETELVTVGSHLVNRIGEFMSSQGRKAHVVLPSVHRTKKSEIASRLQPLNAEFRSLTVEKASRQEVAFVLKIIYLCDEKREELLSVVVDPTDRKARPIASGPFEGLELANGKLRDSFREDRIGELFNIAAAEADRHAKANCADLERDIAGRLHQAIERIDSYYRQLIADLPNPDSMEHERRAAEYEKEHQERRQEAIDNHTLQIRVQLIQYLIVERPLRTFSFCFARKRPTDGREITGLVPLSVDLYDAREFLPRCVGCGKEFTEIAICDSGHAICASCVEKCGRCERVTCSECISETCHLCGASLCEDCFRHCASCGETTCAAETQPCGTCRDPVCAGCQTSCAVCGKLVCGTHEKTCHVSGSPVCVDCIRTCASCGHSVARPATEKCATCGQMVCTNCARFCVVCERRFCPAHAGDIEERKLCPGCVEGR